MIHFWLTSNWNFSEAQHSLASVRMRKECRYIYLFMRHTHTHTFPMWKNRWRWADGRLIERKEGCDEEWNGVNGTATYANTNRKEVWKSTINEFSILHHICAGSTPVLFCSICYFNSHFGANTPTTNRIRMC